MRLVPYKKDFGLSLFEDWDKFLEEPFFKANKEMGLMRTDILEEANAYVINIDLPGFDKNEIKVRMDNDYLVVSCNKEETPTASDKTYLRRERFYGSCSRSFYLGEVDETNIRAQFENGILSISVPKQTPSEKEKKFIQID